jgi:hypothetical protein
MFRNRLLVVLAAIACWSTHADTFYVSLDGSNQPPYDAWANASTDLIAAVRMAGNGDTVLVTNGIYTLTNTIRIANAIALRSVNGPEVTVIDGKDTYACLYLDNEHSGPPLVEGFTITGGNGSLDGGSPGTYGGGITLIYSDAIIRNCFIISNRSANHGGGVFGYQGGNIENCVIRDNSATEGGGLFLISVALIKNSVIVENSATNRGGGIHSDRSWGDIENCTIAQNSASVAGGLCASGAVVRNCIIYHNTALVSSNYEVSGTHGGIEFSCSAPSPSGAGNIALDPVLVSSSETDFHLTSSSPCIDAGTNQEWMIRSTDIDGQVRIFHKRVDIGADEAVVEATSLCGSSILTTRWNTVVGATCQLEYTVSPTATVWDAHGSVITASEPVVHVVLTNDTARTEMYRLNWIR